MAIELIAGLICGLVPSAVAILMMRYQNRMTQEFAQLFINQIRETNRDSIEHEIVARDEEAGRMWARLQADRRAAESATSEPPSDPLAHLDEMPVPDFLVNDLVQPQEALERDA